jgi:hypothetical protein
MHRLRCCPLPKREKFIQRGAITVHDFSQRGAALFPLLGERVRVRAGLLCDRIVPAKGNDYFAP